jgi:hypothetical protein
MNLGRRAELGKAVAICRAGARRPARTQTASVAGISRSSRLLQLSGPFVVDSFDQWNQLLIVTTLLPELLRGGTDWRRWITNADFEKCAAADTLMARQLDRVLRFPRGQPRRGRSSIGSSSVTRSAASRTLVRFLTFVEGIFG